MNRIFGQNAETALERNRDGFQLIFNQTVCFQNQIRASHHFKGEILVYAQNHSVAHLRNFAQNRAEWQPNLSLFHRYNIFHFAHSEDGSGILRGNQQQIHVISTEFSIEGGEAIEGSIDKLYEFYEKGVRLMTLTWNHKNEIGCGALSGITDGLTDFGKSVVKEMNNMNMFIDVSHINEKGFWDVVKTTNKPIIATHSNSFTICNHPRNLKDDQLKAIAEMNGAIGLNTYPPFVRDSESVTSEDLLRHIDFILNKTGENVLGMGTDFDGISKSPKDLEDISKLPKFYDIVSREFGEEIADKIFYKNMQKFFVENI